MNDPGGKIRARSYVIGNQILRDGSHQKKQIEDSRDYYTALLESNAKDQKLFADKRKEWLALKEDKKDILGENTEVFSESIKLIELLLKERETVLNDLIELKTESEQNSRIGQMTELTLPRKKTELRIAEGSTYGRADQERLKSLRTESIELSKCIRKLADLILNNGPEIMRDTGLKPEKYQMN